MEVIVMQLKKKIKNMKYYQGEDNRVIICN